MSEAEFRIVVHPAERVIEVIYPPKPTDASFDRYEGQIRAAITELGPPWRCLVDQRSVPVFDAVLGARIARLNEWAGRQGMEKSVRVVPRGMLAQLQAREIAAQSAGATIAVHYARETAWAELVEGRSGSTS